MVGKTHYNRICPFRANTTHRPGKSAEHSSVIGKLGFTAFAEQPFATPVGRNKALRLGLVTSLAFLKCRPAKISEI